MIGLGTIGTIAMVGGFACSAVSSIVNEKKMNNKIEEEVEKQIEKKMYSIAVDEPKDEGDF